jgi:hypothetical protein
VTDLDRRFSIAPMRHSGNFTLASDPLCDGAPRTRLTLEQSGYRGLKMTLVSFIMEAGWRKLLHKRLPAVLASSDREF